MAKLTIKQKKWFEYMALMLELHHDNHIQFDLSRWIEDNEECGTIACACGLAALNPTFQRAGLRMEDNTIFPSIGFFEDGKQVATAWGAVMRFFGIRHRQAEYLFSASSYKGVKKGDAGAQMVARRIRTFINSNGAVPVKFRGVFR